MTERTDNVVIRRCGNCKHWKIRCEIGKFNCKEWESKYD